MGVELNKLAGLDMTHVGYKGSPPALQDVMGGHVALMFDGPATSIPMLKAGKLKAFAVSSTKRMSALPDVPTFAELGYPQIDDIAWVGLWATPDVPADGAGQVARGGAQGAAAAEGAERFKDLGTDVGQPLTPDAAVAVAARRPRAPGALLKSINFKPE